MEIWPQIIIKLVQCDSSLNPSLSKISEATMRVVTSSYIVLPPTVVSV